MNMHRLISLTFSFYLTFLFFVLISLLFPGKIYADTHNWVGAGGCDGNWSTSANWNPAAVPANSDTVTFNGNSNNCASSIDASFTSTGIVMQLNSGFTGTVTLNESSYTLGNTTISAGIFDTNNINVTMGGTTTVSGGTFNAGSATVAFTGTYSQSSGTLNGTNATLDFNSDFSLSGGTFNEPSGNMYITGNFTVSNSPQFNNNSGTVTFDGGLNNRVIGCSGISFSNVVFNKSYLQNITINSGCSIPLGNSPVVKINIVNNGIISAGTGTVTINGSFTSNNGSTFSMEGTNLIVDRILTLNGGTFPQGITDLNVGMTLNNTGNLLPNNINLTLSAVGSGTITCGSASFNSVSISKTTTYTLSIGSDCTLPLGNSPTISGGITNAGILSIGSGNLSISGGYTQESNGAITMTGNTITISGGLVLNGGSFPQSVTTLSIGGSLDNTANILPNNIDLTVTGSINTLTFACGNAGFSSITINKNSAYYLTPSSSCTTGNLIIQSVNYISNPSSPFKWNVSGNFQMASTGAVGGENLTLEFNGSNSQSITYTTGTFPSKLQVNKSGGSLSLNSDFMVGSTCDITEGVFDTNGKKFTCGSTFTIETGGMLQLVGFEQITTPTFNTGSTVTYKGDGDSLADTYRAYDWAYQNLTVNFTDTTDTLTFSDNLQNNLVGYWKMDEGTGTTVEDSSVNSFTTNLFGNSAFSSTVPSLSFTNPYSMSFDGTGDYLKINNGSSTSLAQNQKYLTVSTWAYFSVIPGLQSNTMFSLTTNNSGVERVTLRLQQDEIQCMARTADSGAGGSYVNTLNSNIQTLQWYHILCTVDIPNNKFRIYLNGVEQDTGLYSAFDASSTPNTMSAQGSIGVLAPGYSMYYLTGYVDDTRFYHRLLGYNEISSLSSGANTNTTNTVSIAGDFTITQGIFSAPQTLEVAGDFINNGTFTHNSGTVVLNGTNQSIGGSTTFYNFTKSITSADTLTFPGDASKTQTFAGTMTFRGASNNLLSLRSSNPGTQWRIDPQGSRAVEFLDVQDSNNINAVQIVAYDLNITNSDRNIGWNFVNTQTLTFSLDPVPVNTSVNGVTTNVASTTNMFPFGDVQSNNVKYVTQKLFVSTTDSSGYTAQMRLATALIGTNPVNNIDPFAGNGATWSDPQTWVSPNGTTPNDNTGWIGINIDDTRVSGWENASGKFAPISTEFVPVMYSATADAGGTYGNITLAMEVNTSQPDDLYTCRVIIDVLPNL